MKCCQCKDDKLSNEFPTVITERCNHISSFCLSCLVEKLDLTNITVNKEIRKCPECLKELSSDEIELLSLAWSEAPFKINFDSIGKVNTNGNINTGEIYIELLNGQRCILQFRDIKNIPMLRKEIKKKLNVDEGKQKLIYNGVKLQDLNNGTPNTLQSYNIGPGSRIQLIIEYYSRASRAERIRDLIFDFCWGYPATGKGYLNASCLVYEGAKFDRKFDLISQIYPNSFPYMRHSGDIMDNTNRIGHESITAKLDKLPARVTQLYFVVSSCGSKNIGGFSNPSYRLIDETQPDKQLCSYQLEQAATSQAVILCCVSRSDQGWEVIQMGKLCDGDVDDYDPIINSIQECSLFG